MKILFLQEELEFRVLFTTLGTDLERLLGKVGRSPGESSIFLVVVSRNKGSHYLVGDNGADLTFGFSVVAYL